jgi:hypothetical protein
MSELFDKYSFKQINDILARHERNKEKCRNYYHNNAESCRQRQKDWYDKNGKQYYQENKEKLIARARAQYEKEHAETIKFATRYGSQYMIWEDQYIIQNYGRMTCKDIALHLRRTAGAIRNRHHILKKSLKVAA